MQMRNVVVNVAAGEKLAVRPEQIHGPAVRPRQPQPLVAWSGSTSYRPKQIDLWIWNPLTAFRLFGTACWSQLLRRARESGSRPHQRLFPHRRPQYQLGPGLKSG